VGTGHMLAQIGSADVMSTISNQRQNWSIDSTFLQNVYFEIKIKFCLKITENCPRVNFFLSLHYLHIFSKLTFCYRSILT
jgi:hypothetical protein